MQPLHRREGNAPGFAHFKAGAGKNVRQFVGSNEVLPMMGAARDQAEAFGGPERRQEDNADLRAEFDEIGKNVTDSPNITETEMSRLFELLRVYQRRGISQRSPDLLLLVREEHADEFSPALLTLLDSALGI